MGSVEALRPSEVSAPILSHLPSLIGSLGDNAFGRKLITFLNETCGAEHCTLFRFSKQSPFEVAAVSRDGTDTAHRQFQLYLAGSYWRGDPTMTEALRLVGSAGHSMQRTDIRSMPNSEFRNRLYKRTHIRERILLCGGTADAAIGLSILRSETQGVASDYELSTLGALSSTLMSILGKHAHMVEGRSNLSFALTSLDEILRTLKGSAVQLSNREIEVCSRILFGISSAGIALDLGIGEETVMTYRKRAYQRLAIATQRELLLWYIAEWSGMQRGVPRLVPTQEILGPRVITE
jgi:DNA-binding CsgD family transcriptional regulator